MRIYDIHLDKYKYELLITFGKYYPEDIAKFRKLRTIILKAIYYKLREFYEMPTKETSRKAELPNLSRSMSMENRTSKEL